MKNDSKTKDAQVITADEPDLSSGGELIPTATPFDLPSIVSEMDSAKSDIFHSFPVNTREDQIKLYNATTGDGYTVKSMVNKIIEVKDVVIMYVNVTNDDGTVSSIPRTTLITPNGDTFNATSWGVFNSVRKMAGVFGGLHFDDPVKVTPVEIKTKRGNTINLKLV